MTKIPPALLFIFILAATPPPNEPQPEVTRDVCTPDRPGARADVNILLTREENAEAREGAGLSHVDPNNLTVVTAPNVCAKLRKQFKDIYKVQGAKSPYVATYYQVEDRFIVHIVQREVLEPAPASPGKVVITDTKILLLVYDQNFTRLGLFLI